jgi:methyl-accepting chemotaxis protein
MDPRKPSPASDEPAADTDGGATRHDLLVALAACDLSGAAEGEGGEGSPSARSALFPLAARLAEARTALARSARSSRRLLEATAELERGVAACAAGLETAARAIERSSPRTEEVAEVVEGLEETAGHSRVAALNLGLEMSRLGSGAQGAATEVAEQVRRLAERSSVVARRLSAVVEAMRAACAEAARDVGVALAAHEGALRRARDAAALADEVVSALGETGTTLRSITLPEDVRAAARARRLVELEERLAAELSEAERVGGELPEEAASALARLRRLLGDLGVGHE